MRIASVALFSFGLGLVACNPSTSAQDAKLATLRANMCQEAGDLPKSLQEHLSQDDQLVQRLAAVAGDGHKEALRGACSDLESSAREDCARLKEFERMASGSASTLGVEAADAGNDRFGVTLCDSLVVSTAACQTDPDEDHANKAHAAVAAFEGSLSKQLERTFSSCPPRK